MPGRGHDFDEFIETVRSADKNGAAGFDVGVGGKETGAAGFDQLGDTVVGWR